MQEKLPSVTQGREHGPGPDSFQGMICLVFNEHLQLVSGINNSAKDFQEQAIRFHFTRTSRTLFNQGLQTHRSHTDFLLCMYLLCPV